MENLDWRSYYNEFSRMQGYQAKERDFTYKVIPDGKLAALKVLDSYTGTEVRIFLFEDYNDALKLAEHINANIKKGLSLDESI